MKFKWIIFLLATIIFTGCTKNDINNFPYEISEDFNGFQLEHPFTTFAGYNYINEFLDNELLEYMFQNISDNYIPSLLEAKNYAQSIDKPVEIVLVMEPGFNSQGRQIQFNEQIAERLSRPQIPFPEDGIYSIVKLQVVTSDPNQSIVILEDGDAEEVAAVADKGGICATLAIAHSLIRRLNNLIPKEATGEWKAVTKTVDGKEVWDADFLKKVYKASGDDDDKRNLSNEEIEKAHTADYSSNWKIRVSKAYEGIKLDGTNLTNAQLEEKCKNLKSMIEDKKDDCLLRMTGKKTVDGREVFVGHRMTITGVDCSDGKMKVKTINTGRQDPNQDWENVPYNPGEEEWTIGTTGITPPAGWNHITWENSYCTCFDEEPKDSGNPDKSRGVPGTDND